MSRLISLSLTLLILIAGAHANAQIDEPSNEKTEVTYSEIRRLIDGEDVVGATVSGDGWWVTVKTRDGSEFYAPVTPQTPIADRLVDAGIPTRIVHLSRETEAESSGWFEGIFELSPIAVLIGLLAFIILTMRGESKSAAQVGNRHLMKAEEMNSEYLVRIERMQNEFFDRLEKVLTERKDHNG